MITLDYSSSSQNSLQNAQSLITNTVNQFIVRPFGNPNLTGISGFLFDILEDEEIVIESLITDNYVEDNIVIQDHIALRPLRFTLKGYVGELTNTFSNQLAQVFISTQTLPFINTIAPGFTIQATQVYSKVNTIAQSAQNVINQAQSLYSLFSGASTNASKQQNGFQFFYGLWNTRQLCSVETPFGKFDNMAIENVRALQSSTTRDISDFTITFKEIRIVKSISNNYSTYAQNLGTSSTDSPLGAGRFQAMIANLDTKGPGSGNLVDTNATLNTFSLLSK